MKKRGKIKEGQKTARVLNVLILLAHQTPALNDHREKGTGLFALNVFFYKKNLITADRCNSGFFRLHYDDQIPVHPVYRSQISVILVFKFPPGFCKTRVNLISGLIKC